MDLEFFNKSVDHELASRPPAPLRTGWHPFAPIRRAVLQLEQQRWFLPAISVFFLLATVEVLGSNLILPLGALSILGVFLL
ncbi:MAG TPA: hypothetical protein VEU07_07385, partial [Candidatus Acidoferrum sp.]|nr:hypothetical protein [Candidatus Acidoferrum sp.]